MDKITLEHTIELDEVYIQEERRWDIQAFLKVNLQINGVLPYEADLYFDYYLFKKALHKNGTYFIFNCTCGTPECAGMDEGVSIKVKNNLVYFHDLDASKKWVLEWEDVQSEIKKIRQRIQNISPLLKEKGLQLNSM